MSVALKPAASLRGILATLTFPDKDLPVGAVVQDEAVAGLQGALKERVLSCYERDGHGAAGVGNLHERDNEMRHFSLFWQFYLIIPLH